ncbi:MAG: hypothetical protein AAFR04_13945 [Pseudomonadota bacterium]
MNHNLLASDRFAVVGAINPASHAAGDVSTGWVSMADFHSLLAVVHAGTLGASATLDAKVEQAQDATGTGVKDVEGRAITQLTQAGGDSDKQALINLRSADLDFAEAYTHVRLTVTVGAAASQAAAMLFATDPRYGSASDNDALSVAEIVS